jgi:predicted enzyme related to lactoylglutathione lyase
MTSRGEGADPVLRKVDAVTIRVPDLDQGLAFYRDRLGHELLWRNDEIGQAGLRLPESDTEIVLSTELDYAPSWLVGSADDAASRFVEAGGRIVAEPFDIPVGRCVVVADAFGNHLVLLDLSKGLYRTDDNGSVTGLETPRPGDPLG